MLHEDSPRRCRPAAFGLAAVIGLIFALIPAAPTRAAEPGEGELLFARRVAPLLAAKCVACHGGEAKLQGGLDLRSRAGLARGGDSGPAVDFDRVDASPLLLAVGRASDAYAAMPPKENDRLSPEQVAALRRWLQLGAPWPGPERLAELARLAPVGDAPRGVKAPAQTGLTADWSNREYQPADLWAFQPLRREVPPTARQGASGNSVSGDSASGEIDSNDLANGGNAIDAFIARRQREMNVTPAPRATRPALLRRVTFDLIGLPPTLEEMADFVADPASDEQAFARVVDRLLASPHYGEQWGRRWLDVSRYADSSGFANDYERGSAWRYRDYVTRAFNADKPLADFIREQVAGDEFDPSNPEALVAAGFLRMGPWELTGMEVAKVARQRFLDDVTDIVGQAFLALPLQCARCHDHKFDPISTRDYYALQAVFATTQIAERDAPFLPVENRAGFEEARYLKQRQSQYEADRKKLDLASLAAAPAWCAQNGDVGAKFKKILDDVVAKGGRKNESISAYKVARDALAQTGVPEEKLPPPRLGYTPREFGIERLVGKNLERITWELDRYQPQAFSVYAGRTPGTHAVYQPLRMPLNRLTGGELETTAILAGGDPFSPGEPVAPGVLPVLAGFNEPLREALPQGVPKTITGRRKALANWLADPRNPLPARVMSNRVWQGHFGRGLAGNPNNFGVMGQKPTHPELLDFLASELLARGGSLKSLHRLILLSETYQRSTIHPRAEETRRRDPRDESYAVFRPRRLEAEELRDALLRASGELNLAIGGIPIRPEINVEVAWQPRQVMGAYAPAWQPSPRPEQRHRRSLYALRLRGLRDPFFEAFNQPGSEFSCERRDESNVASQVFSLLNSEASQGRALALAARALRETSAPAEAIERLFALAHQRRPTADEARLCLTHWQAQTARHAQLRFEPPARPTSISRTAVEELSGEVFTFEERLESARDFVPDLHPSAADAATRGLAEVCLALLNSHEFVYVY